MRFFAILLVVLGAGFGWAMWQGIDLVTDWLVDAEVPAPDWLALDGVDEVDELDEVELTSADQDPAAPDAAVEIEETIVATSELAPEPAQDPGTEAPIEVDTTLEVASEEPALDTALPAPPSADVAVAEPVSVGPTLLETSPQPDSAAGSVTTEAAAPDPAPQPAATPPAAEAAVSDPDRPEPDISVASEPLVLAPTVPEPAPEVASVAPEAPASPEPVVELPAPEPAATVAPAGEPAQPAQSVQAETPQCNIQACTAAYRSFRASDCTYQPFEGPRQVCPLEPQVAEPLVVEAATQPAQGEALQCNIERCTAAFRSFRASDCSYQPFEGARQICPY